MGQVRHGSATTTHAVRAAIQRRKRYPIGFFHIDIAQVQTAEPRDNSS